MLKPNSTSAGCMTKAKALNRILQSSKSGMGSCEPGQKRAQIQARIHVFNQGGASSGTTSKRSNGESFCGTRLRYPLPATRRCGPGDDIRGGDRSSRRAAQFILMGKNGEGQRQVASPVPSSIQADKRQHRGRAESLEIIRAQPPHVLIRILARRAASDTQNRNRDNRRR